MFLDAHVIYCKSGDFFSAFNYLQGKEFTSSKEAIQKIRAMLRIDFRRSADRVICYLKITGSSQGSVRVEIKPGIV